MEQTELSPDEITAVILAGGRSSRMGCDKTLARLGATPVVLHQLELMAPFVSHALIAVNHADKFSNILSLSPVPAQTVLDNGQLYEGPFAGILAAAHRARTEWLFVRAADMPWLVPELAWLLMQQVGAQVDAVVARGADDYPEPLCALYRRTHVCHLQAAFDAGKRKVSTLFGGSRTIFLNQERVRLVDPQLSSFQNINYPDQLAHVQQMFSCSLSRLHDSKGTA